MEGLELACKEDNLTSSNAESWKQKIESLFAVSLERQASSSYLANLDIEEHTV